MGYSDLLHWLRIFGIQGSSLYQAARSRETVGLLTAERKIYERFGQAGVIVPTQDGVRFLSRLADVELKAEARPTHPFQELAVFGELGLPAATPVFAEKQRFTLRDCIRDCLSNLQTREVRSQEPEWPTQAIAHFLPPARSWENRWGERVTLDQWANFLVDREMSQFSCGGTHLLHSLAMLLQADTQYGLLDSRSVARIREVCRSLTREVESSQHADGAWRADWSDDGLGRSYDRIDIHLTGHILEAQLYLPEELRISDRSAESAIRYLVNAFRIADDPVVAEEYCFYSHAGNVLLRCREKHAVPALANAAFQVN